MGFVCKVCKTKVAKFGEAPTPALCHGGAEHDFANQADLATQSKLQEQLDEMRSRKFDELHFMNDSKIKIFGDAGSIHTPPFPQDIREHPYWRKCLACGRNHKKGAQNTIDSVGRAHILINSNRPEHVLTYEQFGTAAGYSTNFDGFSVRNHIPLCGTKGVSGSCHDAFDTHAMTIIYNPLTRKLQIYWSGNDLHRREVAPPDSFFPYRRLLNFRSRFQALLTHDVTLLDLSNLGYSSHASDAEEPPSKKRRRGKEENSW